jgi:Exocyst complex component Sec5
MYLVEVHAQVCAAAEPLLARVLNFLADELAREALDCFRKVTKFGMGGMLRVSCGFLRDLHVPRSADQIAFRPRWKLSSCTRRSGDTSLISLPQPSPKPT